jgi:hypothetical protein
MELTYKVKGADGKEYGPVTLEQINGWIRDGRVKPQQEVQRSDMQHWAAAGDFTEMQPMFGPTAVAAAADPASEVRLVQPAAFAQRTAAQLRSGASWFYWIAGLSLINSLLAFGGQSWRFIFGLGITQLLDALGGEIASGGKFIALVLDLVVAGVFVLLGVFSHKGHLWAFIVGMVLFALDGLVFLLIKDWLGIGIHAFVLYCLYRGFEACRQLRKAQGLGA